MNTFTEIPIICYHSIGPQNLGWSRNFLTMELPYFEAQIRYFRKHFTNITLKQYWEIKNGLNAAPKNPLVLTFDDGYLDNWIWAYPLLRKYELKATIFVSPEFVDLQSDLRPNLDDFNSGRASWAELHQWGYLSWNEMLEMAQSGIIDIQSHTMTHAKYVTGDYIRGFHHPGADVINVIGNLYPEKRPYYIQDEGFEKLIPYGTPLFEEQSSVIARIHEIHPDFSVQCCRKLADYPFENYRFEEVLSLIRPIYEEFRKNNTLIICVESEDSYMERLRYEIVESMNVLETRLKKKIEFLCWPHGDNNETAHQMAREAGYLATTSGKSKADPSAGDRIPQRLGVAPMWGSSWLGLKKLHFKIDDLRGSLSASLLKKTYRKFK